MFTGIIKEVGTIQSVTQRDELIELRVASNVKPAKGASICVDGACLSVTTAHGDGFTVEAVPETLKRTIIKNYREGTKVNLEPSLKAGDPLDGHFVSGHVDGIGTVQKIDETKNSKTLTIEAPENLRKFLAMKGSVTVNGVSLTMSGLSADAFRVALIPETLHQTNLGLLKEKNLVNLEVDLIARYLDSLLQDKEKQASYQFLTERGFL